jgi:hypothetical protein
MLSLLYVSASVLGAGEVSRELTRIVDTSVSWNLRVGITGALVLAQCRFAQALEGPEEEVRELMARIRADSRHTSVRVIRTAFQSERRFPNWGMALLAAPEPFALLSHEASTAERPASAADRIMTLMVASASANFSSEPG